METEKVYAMPFAKIYPMLVDELAKIEPYLRARHPISITDFYLFPVLNSLTIVKGFPYPEYLSDYLDHVATSCNVPLFTDKAL